MCLGLPMQVRHVEAGRAWVEGRGERRRVDLALVGEVAPGDWLLVHLNDARERIDARRAAEVDAALDLVEAAMAPCAADATADETGCDTGCGRCGTTPPAWADPAADPGFALPSAMDAATLARLTGQA